MKRGMIIRLLGVAGMLLSLGACAGLGEQLGLTKQAPDEFRVVSRAPLSIPPEFRLRPPEPGAPRPQEGTTRQQARTAVFRAAPQAPTLDQVTAADGRTLGERALLKLAGADRAEPNIREIVDRETDRVNEESDEFVNALIFWRGPRQPGVLVDAEAEARRIRENAALGKSITSGETPIIERKRDTLFESLF